MAHGRLSASLIRSHRGHERSLVVSLKPECIHWPALVPNASLKSTVTVHVTNCHIEFKLTPSVKHGTVRSWLCCTVLRPGDSGSASCPPCSSGCVHHSPNEPPPEDVAWVDVPHYFNFSLSLFLTAATRVFCPLAIPNATLLEPRLLTQSPVHWKWPPLSRPTS